MALRQRGNQPLDLLAGPVRDQRQRTRARVHRHRHTDPGIAPRQFLEHEDVGEEVGPGTRESLRDADPHQPELSELGEHVLRERVIAVPVARPRCDHLIGEAARQRSDLHLLVG